jgi:ectoine hydroxylase-related dioxygenase (phytanoyl-CoA dioxygenase family)
MKILTNSNLDFFKENGYLIVDNVFSKKDLDTVKKALQDMIFFLIKKAIKDNPDRKNDLEACIGDEFSRGIKVLEEIDHKYILEFYDSLSVKSNPYIASLSYSSEVLEVVNILLEKPNRNPLFVTSGSSVFAMPNDDLHTPNKWHTDIFYSIKDSEYIQIWAPLIEDTNKELGALHIMPKSHKVPFQGQVKDTSRTDSNVHRYVGSGDLLGKYEDKIVEMKLGQVVFFDKHLFHRGGNNITDRVRLSLVGVYHSMENPDFKPYPFNHPKQVTSDEYFDQMVGKI